MLAACCPHGASHPGWTWFVNNHLHQFAVKSCHFASLRRAITMAYVSYTKVVDSLEGVDGQQITTRFVPVLERMLKEFTPDSNNSHR